MAFLSKSNQQKRKDPLLPQTKAHADATTGGSDIKATTEKCGTCGRLTLLLLPIFGCSMILSVLYLLVFRLDIKVSNSTVSAALADYEPTYEILLLLCTGAFAMFVVTAARNIQINVYHRRQKSSSTFQQLVNFVAALANIVAYFGFIILAAYPIDSEVARERKLHLVGAYLYFGLSGVYGLLHTFLLWKQRQYPLFAKLLLTVVPVMMVVCSIVFAVNQEEACEYEWFAVALAALFVGLFFILFLVDRVDDELQDFFCCKRQRSTKTVR
jgi:uncharacterized membrane protein YecN with MAPEG domain